MAFFTFVHEFTVTSGMNRDTIHELYELHCPWFFTGATAPFVASTKWFTDVLVSSKVLQVTPHIHELFHCVLGHKHWLSSE